MTFKWFAFPVSRLLLLSLVLTCMSCSANVLPKSLHRHESSLYCSILHVPDDVPAPFEKKAYLGVIMEPVTPENSLVDECNEFIRIADTVDESPADKAGLKTGDIMLSANGISVCGEGENILKEFKQFIENQELNSKIILEILREEEKLSLTASLEEKPFQIQNEASHENFKKCVDQTSLLNREFRKQDNLPLFNKIRSGLNYHSNFHLLS